MSDRFRTDPQRSLSQVDVLAHLDPAGEINALAYRCTPGGGTTGNIMGGGGLYQSLPPTPGRVWRGLTRASPMPDYTTVRYGAMTQGDSDSFRPPAAPGCAAIINGGKTLIMLRKRNGFSYSAHSWMT